MTIRNFKLNQKQFYVITLALIIWLGIRLANAPMERDEGEYAYAGWQILEGKLPYLNFYNMKFPGTYFFYALIFKCFGLSIFAVRVVCLFLNIASSFFIIKIAEKVLGKSVNYLTGGVFLLFCMSFGAQGFIANTEHFVIFFAMLGIWLLKEDMPLAAGINLATACLMKQHGFFYVLLAAFFILISFLQTKNIKKSLISVLSLGLGYAIPFVIFFAYLILNNIVSPFYFFAIEYAAAYSTIAKPTFKYISTYKYLFIDNVLFWIVFWTALWHIIKHKLIIKNIFKYSEENFLLVFLIISFISICPGWYFRPHYFQLIFPVSALIVAYGFKNYDTLISYKNKQFTRYNLLAVALVISIASQLGYFFIKSPNLIIDKLYEGEYFTDFRDVGLFLKDKLKVDDKIGMYGSDPQILFYAQKESASGYMYAYPMVENQPLAEQMMFQYIHEIETVKPEWLVYLTASKGEDNKKNIIHLDTWFESHSQNYYKLSGIFYEDKTRKYRLFWSESKLDTSYHPVVYVYQKR